MRSSADKVSLMTAVKMMSFGVPVGCEDPVLTRHFFKGNFELHYSTVHIGN